MQNRRVVLLPWRLDSCQSVCKFDLFVVFAWKVYEKSGSPRAIKAANHMILTRTVRNVTQWTCEMLLELHSDCIYACAWCKTTTTRANQNNLCDMRISGSDSPILYLLCNGQSIFVGLYCFKKNICKYLLWSLLRLLLLLLLLMLKYCFLFILKFIEYFGIFS